MSPWAAGDLLNSTNLNAKTPRWYLTVDDFGATGDGVTDDTTAFNSAISAAGSGGYGADIHVSGNSFYKITSTLTLGSHHLIGAFHGNPSQGPFIFGNFNAPLITLSGTGGSVEGVGLQQSNTSTNASCIKALDGTIMTRISHCYATSGNHGFLLGSTTNDNTFAALVENCFLDGSGSNGTRSATSGSIGIFAQACALLSNRITHFDRGIRVGTGSCFIGHPEVEVNYTGIEVGFDLAGNALITQGLNIAGGHDEANDIGLDIQHAGGFVVSGFRTLSSSNCPSGQGIAGVRLGSAFDGALLGCVFTQNGPTPYTTGAVVTGTGSLNVHFVGCATTAGSTNSIPSGSTGVTFANCNFIGDGGYIGSNLSSNIISPRDSKLSFTGSIDYRGASLSLRTTSSSASASNLSANEIAVVAVSTTSAQLAFRSGNTVYIVNADATSL